MIYLKAHIVSKRRNGQGVWHNQKTIQVWNNSFLNEIPINYLEPREVKAWLRDVYRLPNGKKLPLRTSLNEKIVYIMFIFGLPEELTERARFFAGKMSAYLNLYPGYPGDEEKYRDPETGKIKVLDFVKYGGLI